VICSHQLKLGQWAYLLRGTSDDAMAVTTPLRLSSFNCRSVKSSVDEVKQLCDISSIVMLQEHWLMPK